MIKNISGIKLDVKQNEIRYRVQNPSKFDTSSFRRKNIKKGIDLLIGCPKGEFRKNIGRCIVGTQTQAVRFDRESFNPSEAARWIKSHGFWHKIMKKELLDILCCPMCKGNLILKITEENEKEIVNGTLRCKKCEEHYPIDDNIPNMLPPELRNILIDSS